MDFPETRLLDSTDQIINKNYNNSGRFKLRLHNFDRRVVLSIYYSVIEPHAACSARLHRDRCYRSKERCKQEKSLQHHKHSSFHFKASFMKHLVAFIKAIRHTKLVTLLLLTCAILDSGGWTCAKRQSLESRHPYWRTWFIARTWLGLSLARASSQLWSMLRTSRRRRPCKR